MADEVLDCEALRQPKCSGCQWYGKDAGAGWCFHDDVRMRNVGAYDDDVRPRWCPLAESKE